MKRHKLFYVSALSMMLACSSACNDEMVGHGAPPEADVPAVSDANAIELTSDEMTILRTMDGNSPKISQDEAISIAAKFLDKNQLSKSTSGVRCDVVTRKKPSISKTETDESDTLMYVLNYGNNDGYALVCADIRVPEQILAYSETGSMDTETDNPGVQLFMDMAEDYMDANIAEIESKRDSLEEVIQGKFAETSEYQKTHLSKSRTFVKGESIDYYKYSVTKITEKQEPLLHTFWHQVSPYNNYVPDCKDEKCPNKGTPHKCLAGCVAISTGQLMAYWKHPQYVDGVAMNWNTMYFNDKYAENNATNNNYNHRVATLIKYIGEKIGMYYGCDTMGGSSASTKVAVEYLSKIGYYTKGLIQYNKTEAIKSLRNRYPVPIIGYEINKKGRYYNGHSWLIDGYLETTTTTTCNNMYIATYMEDWGKTTNEYYYSTYVSDHNEYYFHCNWGWRSDKDGYYLSNVFDSHHKYELSSSATYIYPDRTEFKKNINYKYGIEIAPNIHR